MIVGTGRRPGGGAAHPSVHRALRRQVHRAHLHAARDRVCGAQGQQVRALRGALRGQGSGHEGHRHGLAARRPLAGFRSGEPAVGQADACASTEWPRHSRRRWRPQRLALEQDRNRTKEQERFATTFAQVQEGFDEVVDDAAAGGVPFAVAADHVVAREDVVLNPYYQHMGGLYGSEYWTYVLPRRVGHEIAAELTSAPFNPIGTRRAVEIGLLDATFGDSIASFRAQVQGLAERLARHPDAPHWLEQKRRERARDEQTKPLAAYRSEEMARSHECFFGEDRSYHVARGFFVYKTGAPCTVQVPPSPRAPSARADAGAAGGDQGPSNEAVRRAMSAVAGAPSVEEGVTSGAARGSQRARPRAFLSPGRLARSTSGSASSTGCPRASCSPSTSFAAGTARSACCCGCTSRRCSRSGCWSAATRVVHVTSDVRAGRPVRRRGQLGSLPPQGARDRRLVRPHHLLGGAGRSVERDDRGALPLLRDDRRPDPVSGLDAVPGRDRLHGHPPRSGRRARRRPRSTATTRRRSGTRGCGR